MTTNQTDWSDADSVIALSVAERFAVVLEPRTQAAYQIVTLTLSDRTFGARPLAQGGCEYRGMTDDGTPWQVIVLRPTALAAEGDAQTAADDYDAALGLNRPADESPINDE